MRKREKLQIIRNVGSSWITLGMNVVVGLFLSPFILHRVGDAAFGIWVLIFSITGYYGLLDLGIRSSVVRYVAQAKATGDMEYASRVVSTSLFSYCVIGAAAFFVTMLIGAYLSTFSRIAPEFQSTARWLLLMVGSAVAVGFPLGIWGGVLEGLQRFDVMNFSNLISTLLRALMIVLALSHGYGLLMLAFITVALPTLASIFRFVIVRRLLPLRLRLSNVDRQTFREMAYFGGFSFISAISSRLRFKSDEIVIGSFLGSVAITYFNIGGRIVDYAEEVVEGLAQVFVPMSSHSDARGDLDRQRKIFVAGNRFCAFITFPICAFLVILGKSVIEAWVGQKYVAQSYPVLLLMVLPSTLMMAQSASSRILFGMAKHKAYAIVTLTEGIVNVLLSVLLIRPYGIIGDAIGTAIPLCATMIFFLPAHLCSLLRVRIRTYLREAYLLPLLVCAPLIVALLLLKRWFVPHGYRQLAVHTTVAGAVYGLALLWAYVSKRATRIGNLYAAEAVLDEPAPVGAAVDQHWHDI